MSQSLSFAKLAAQFQTVSLQTLLWRPKAKTNADGLAPIMLRITVDGRRIERSSGLRVAEADWEPKGGGRIRGNSTLVKKQNEQLQLLKAHVSELVNLMKATGRIITVRTLALQLESPSVGKAPCFIALCQQQLDLHYGGNPVSYAARQHGLRTLINWRGRTADGQPVPLPLDEFTPELAANLYQWLLSVRRQKVSTANAVIGTLTTLFKRAAEMGLVELSENPFRLLRTKKKAPVQRLRLSLAQFAALRDKQDLCERAGLARDVYVAQYYLHGSRLGAVLMLRWQDVTPTHVRLQAEKGGPLKNIRLAPELARVLARYRSAAADPAALVFPVLPAWFHTLLTPSGQFTARKAATTAINKGLLLAGEAVGLPTGLHSHTARHTLALHAATAAGIRVAQTMLGHASMKQTEAYVGELPDEALNEAERLLYGVAASPASPPAPTLPVEGGRVVPMWAGPTFRREVARG
jgi:integrase